MPAGREREGLARTLAMPWPRRALLAPGPALPDQFYDSALPSERGLPRFLHPLDLRHVGR